MLRPVIILPVIIFLIGCVGWFVFWLWRCWEDWEPSSFRSGPIPGSVIAIHFRICCISFSSGLSPVRSEGRPGGDGRTRPLGLPTPNCILG